MHSYIRYKKGISLIKSALLRPLPGVLAQHMMAPKLRKSTPELLQASESHRLSSVLILLFPDAEGNMHTLFIERPTNNSVHSGQIAFPGGKEEPDDRDSGHTALRETEEEIGVAAASIELLGNLSPLFIPASNFLVQPHIGTIASTPLLFPNPGEVQSVIKYPVDELLRLAPHSKEFPTSYGNLLAPYFNINGHAVWGATAMMISEFREMMRGGE